MNYLIILFFTSFCYCQEYYIDNNNINALRLYKCKNQLQASINVFFVKSVTQVSNNGLWYIGKRTTTSQAIRFVKRPEQAQIIYYQVNYIEQSGSKKRG